jgi:DNA-binding CsgD family transcriptional regulator
MSEAVERYAEQCALSYVEEERCKTIERMLGRGKTPEEISEFCEYDLKFVKKVQESMAQIV